MTVENLAKGMSGLLVEVEFAEDEWEAEGAAKEDELAGPPLPTVRSVAATFAAPETQDHSSH